MMRRAVRSLPFHVRQRRTLLQDLPVMDEELPTVYPRPGRTAEEKAEVVALLSDAFFVSGDEYVVRTKPRTNVVREYKYQRDARLEAVTSVVAEAEAADPRFLDLDSLVAAKTAEVEAFKDRVQRYHDFAESNAQHVMKDDDLVDAWSQEAFDDLPTEYQWAITKELDNWLPVELRKVAAEDFQQIAAYDAKKRVELQGVVNKVAQEFSAKATTEEDKAALKAIVEASLDQLDPTRHITAASIKEQTDVATLYQWAKAVKDYNGDDRILLIFEAAATISKTPKAAELVKSIRGTVYA